MNIMDFANDDRFGSSWQSNTTVKQPWYEIDFDKDQRFNMISIVEDGSNIKKYRLEYNENGTWKPLTKGEAQGRVKIHRFDSVWGGKVRILIDEFSAPPAIAEFGVYNERR
jgi:alpha-L-fucosidase